MFWFIHQRCVQCGQENHIAIKKCRNEACQTVFEESTKDWAKVKNKGKTSSSAQLKILQYRADVLNMHHDYDVVMLWKCKHGRGHTFSSYGTCGYGQEFLKASGGNLAKDLFKKFQSSKTRTGVEGESTATNKGQLTVNQPHSFGSPKKSDETIVRPIQTTPQTATVNSPISQDTQTNLIQQHTVQHTSHRPTSPTNQTCRQKAIGSQQQTAELNKEQRNLATNVTSVTFPKETTFGMFGRDKNINALCVLAPRPIIHCRKVLPEHTVVQVTELFNDRLRPFVPGGPDADAFITVGSFCQWPNVNLILYNK